MTDGYAKNFEEGMGICQSVGGILALPRNMEENHALSKLLSINKAQYVFLGATDRMTESLFVDTAGKTLHFFNWAQNEPNSYGGDEDCVIIRSGGDWNDVPCDHQYNIVCELS